MDSLLASKSSTASQSPSSLINRKPCLQNSVPTITVDNCEGVEIYLKKESKLTEIVTSKSSEVVMNFEKDKPVNEDDEWETYSIPSQFVTKIGDDTPTTKEVVHMA